MAPQLRRQLGDRVYVLGVGMSPFLKPNPNRDYPQMGLEAGTKALLDAGITYDEVEQGFACYAYGDSTSGQRVFYQFGMTGIPIINVNNACATGSSGLYLARQSLSLGGADVALVIGFEKMMAGRLKKFFTDRSLPQGLHAEKMFDLNPNSEPGNISLFGNAGLEYIEKHDAIPDDLAEIARVNHLHSAKNPYSQFQTVYTLDEIKNSPALYGPVTKLQCCPTSDGAAAAVLVSERWLHKHPEYQSKAIEIAGQAIVTDQAETFGSSSMDLIGFQMTKRAVSAALAEANTPVARVGVCELHDCFAANELVTIDALGLCEPGKAGQFVRSGNISHGGRVVVNPSGGLISKGHPLGATGLAQCTELVWQLRGWANNRLAPYTTAALQHNLGLGGAAVVSVYKRADGLANTPMADNEVAGVSGLGYNPATEVRQVSVEQIKSVLSRSYDNQWARVGGRGGDLEAPFLARI
ncbi:sterol carrier protein 2 [Blastomyces parvus]|uniref:propanoyl-CoA C-acyltransferase n=1 Tax=Blastomyces parvus TaxID=2060905 RepID=A0A2B7X3C7_9EURO|nr:sterol carrier protein 2 [Blastomyces parvus]